MATIKAGPLTEGTVPEPTGIDCIVVDKVYDSCSQTITATQTFLAPAVDLTVTGCAIDLSTSTCTVGVIAPSDVADYCDITFVISVNYAVTFSSGVTVPETLVTTQVVTLYNPTGTTPTCTILSGTCTCVMLPNGNVSCAITICMLFQTTATVQLLVPTYGFCVPAVCPAVAPVLPCPPSPLFPPQLT